MAKKEKSEGISETPLMKQYLSIKGKYPDAILLFRVGDFYESFGEDAIVSSRVLGIVLTKRANGSASHVELAGFPYHSLESYLPKLVRAGYRVAICEQLEDPKLTKTIVKRGVTELITPGLTMNENVLDNKTNNFLCAIFPSENVTGVAFLDISTGEFLTGEGDTSYVQNLIQSLQPKEVVYPKPRQRTIRDRFGDSLIIYGLDEWIFDYDFCRDLLLRQFGITTLKGFGIDDMHLATIASGSILHYLSETQNHQIAHINTLSRIDQNEFVRLDNFTIRNLELVSSQHDKAMTLHDVVDRTCTPMGARMLRRWLIMPLKDIHAIEQRLHITGYFYENRDLHKQIQACLKDIGDLERITGRIATSRIAPREMIQLRRALESIEQIRQSLSESELLKPVVEQLNPCQSVINKVKQEILDSAPSHPQKGGVFANNVNAELDELRNLAGSGRNYLVQIQQREIERTGISSLKIGFNNVYGYYLEVTHVHKEKVPDDWIRRQTLTNAERYVTPELKEYETKILGAEERILALELSLYTEFIQWLHQFIPTFQLNARLLAEMDCLQGFAEVASQNQYRRPEINEGHSITILQGRHPVIERALPVGESYIPNDIHLDELEQQIIIITGPNMSGKSAILRQTALIVLLAQVGSFVPAAEARIGIVDKIFTRVGASDNLSMGESTFMVEMNETASILNNLSERCLILLDEIGRGTSTYDGISIAWSIAEYLHEHAKFKPKTLFATHYHELNEMASRMPRIRNFHVSVKEVGNKVIFLRKLEPGGSEHSFGIHVARMAGMPHSIIQRANEVMKRLEKSHHDAGRNPKKDKLENLQLSFFQLDDPVLLQIRDELENTDINSLTPVEALMRLNEIKKIIGIKK